MNSNSALKRFAVLAYAVACYAMFLAVFLYALGFLGNIGISQTLDSAPRVPLTTALLINGLLLGMFALQHSGMARPTFKHWWTRIVPQPIERSTYVLFSNLAMIVIFWLWQPLGGVVWHVESGVGRALLYALYAVGTLIVLYSTMLLSHFDLFGVRQAWFYFRGVPYKPVPFRVPSLYRFVRHPLYVGWLTVVWSAPKMTMGHLAFAAGITAYILIAIHLEERNLADSLPGYAEYRQRVPMLLPWPIASTESADTAAAETNSPGMVDG